MSGFSMATIVQGAIAVAVAMARKATLAEEMASIERGDRLLVPNRSPLGDYSWVIPDWGRVRFLPGSPSRSHFVRSTVT